VLNWIMLTIAGGGLNRARGWGESKVPNVVWAVLWGLLLGGVTFEQEYLFVGLFAVLFTLGSRPGWGQPMGEALGGKPSPTYEKWQVGVLRENVTAALAVRGVIWAAPVLPLAYFNTDVVFLLPALVVGFTAGPYIAKAVIKNDPPLLKNLKKRWAWSEIITGVITTGLYVGII